LAAYAIPYLPEFRDAEIPNYEEKEILLPRIHCQLSPERKHESLVSDSCGPLRLQAFPLPLPELKKPPPF